jgi:hypothetical protein
VTCAARARDTLWGSDEFRYSGLPHTKNPIKNRLRRGAEILGFRIPMSKPKRVAIYVRVSTDAQSTIAQRQELEAWAERAGHTVVCVYEDQGISGAKGRDQRPQFDALLKAAIRREFNEAARRELAKGTGVLKTAKLVGLGTGTVQRLKHAVVHS